jgi:hypothetical protein
MVKPVGSGAANSSALSTGEAIAASMAFCSGLLGIGVIGLLAYVWRRRKAA